MRIIPAIDLIDGKCVRLQQGDFNLKTVYANDPVEVALSFQDHGISYLHLVDLDGAKSGSTKQLHILERIARATQLNIDFGGGIKTTDDVRSAFDAGATQITAGSIAAKDFDLVASWVKIFGANKIVLGADVRNQYIAVAGWKETVATDIDSYLTQYRASGIEFVICTDISVDGTLAGPSIDLYKNILKNHQNIKLVASGGVSTYDDLLELQSINIEGVIIGKAIYEGRITLSQLGKLC